MMSAYPMSAAAAAVVAAGGGSCLPPSAASFCNLPWICPSQAPQAPPPHHPHQSHSAERLLQPSMSRRDGGGGGGHLEELVVPGSSHHMLALHNSSSVGPSPYFPLDSPSLMYSYYLGFGNADVRRKNATRESTSTLKAWLYEHRKNPYPTKGEKIMLAIITKMTLTQVSTWFANARRRLKKENKGEWGLKDTNDVDEDDFEDDIVHSDGGIANASASDTSSPRCSPDLPRLLSPSDDDPMTSRSITSAAGSAASPMMKMMNSEAIVRISDDVKDDEEDDDEEEDGQHHHHHHHRHPSSNSPSAVGGIVKDSSSASMHPTPSSVVPHASSHVIHHPIPTSNLDRLAPPNGGDPNNSGAGVAGSSSSSVAPAKRKLWSIDDIVSPSHPTTATDASRSQGESSNPGPLHCGPLIDRALPYKYGPYFIDATRFGREGFEPRAPLYRWITTRAGNGFEGEGVREVRRVIESPSNEFKDYRNGFFNRPPSLTGVGFTSENRHDYQTDVFKTENQNFKTEDDCHRTAS